MKGCPYSKTSRARLYTCHPKIIKLFESLAEDYNITIVCGHRTEEEQNEAYANEKSQVKWPNGKHNTFPSRAIDAMLYPLMWEDTGRCHMFAGVVLERARALGIKIRWGGDWDSDWTATDERFRDLVHFELEEDEE